MSIDQARVTRNGPPDFLIVGSPRSGTTLVQRLASELPGVRVTPETHFYAVFYERHLRGVRFPVEETSLRPLLQKYVATGELEGIRLDVDRIVDEVGGRCESSWAMFRAIVTQMAGGGSLIGEKTPNHLRWWKPLSRLNPALKFVVVVRDPRAVAASAKAAPFGMDSVLLLASRWREDMRDLEHARRALDSSRLLVLRYEDVVTDPEGARLRLGAFLGVSGPSVPIEQQHDVELFLPWESGWKAQARGPVEAARATAWRERLSDREVRQVEIVLTRQMVAAGYAPDSSDRLRSSLSIITPKDLMQLALSVRARHAERRRIHASEVTGAAT